MLMGNKSLIIIDYGVDCWKQHGVTEQYHLRSWSPNESWSNPADCIGNDGRETLDNLGSYDSKASAHEIYNIKTIANAIYDYDAKYLHTSGSIYWYDYTENDLSLV